VVASPAIFETGADVDTVVLDKTGTLTDGGMTVREVIVVDGPAGDAADPVPDGGAEAARPAATDPATLRRRASAVESLSTHPVATAVADAGDGSPAAVTDFESARRGVAGRVDGHRVVVGHPAFVRKRGAAVPDDLAAVVASARDEGHLPVVVAWDGPGGLAARGCLVVGDRPRPDWEPVVERLGRDAEVVVLTGDDPGAAADFEAHPAVDAVYAGVPPDGKEATVRRLAAAGTVAMVGDGSNDAPALAAADVGIALDGGTQLAGDAADAVVGDLGAVPADFAVAGATRRRIRGSLAWAFLYNAVAIPLAALGLINPLFAAVAMATSSLLVVANSARSLSGE
jgi:Cu2+-exporting ATPase